MVDIYEGEERPDFLELIVDRVVGVEDEQPGKIINVFGKAAVFVNGGVVVQPVFHADFIVLLAVAGGDVNAACTRFEGDEGGEDEDAFPVNEGMAGLEALHDGPGELVEDLVGFTLPSEGVEAVIEKVFG
jgi:hypothetical protein